MAVTIKFDLVYEILAVPEDLVRTPAVTCPTKNAKLFSRQAMIIINARDFL